ncbi:MAG: PAS domain S-box protein [Gammaproteobacteria bacterium]|nr:PAS domain S-box protein [Gammaproteobacteria bacterium]
MEAVLGQNRQPSRYGFHQPEYVQDWSEPVARPMKRALLGETGVIWARDYRDIWVLAAHAPVIISDQLFGMVIKVDASTIWQPMLRATLLVILLAALGIYLGARRFLSLINPLIEELEEKNSANEAMIRTSPSGIVILNADGRVLVFNPAAEALLGYRADEMMGQPITRLMDPDVAARHEMALTRFIQTPERHAAGVQAKVSARHKNGISIPVHIDIGVIPLPNALHLVGIISDLRAQKAIEFELRQHRDELEHRVAQATTEIRAIIETAVSGIITISPQGIIQLFNPAAERLFGWQAGEVIGKNVSVLMQADIADQHDHYLASYLRTGQAKIIGVGREITAQRKDGSLFPAHLAVGHAVVNEEKQFFVGFVTDISVQKAHEQQLKQAKEAAEAGCRAKAAFIANVSHEVRTPMNTVIGYTELLMEDATLAARTVKYAEHILVASKALLAIINNILDVAKLESGKLELENIGFNLQNFLVNLMQTLESSATNKGLRLEYALDPGLPVRVMGDPDQLRHIILNLMSNALKFTHDGSVSLAVTLADHPEQIRFTISDTGIGMAREQVAALFAPFVQADDSTTRRYSGSGLGTAISKQLVELMGGTIEVESELGKGSLFHFTVRLPGAPENMECLFDDCAAPGHLTRPARQSQEMLSVERLYQPALQPLINDLLTALDTHDLVSAEALLHELTAVQPDLDLTTIINELNAFEFEKARVQIVSNALLSSRLIGSDVEP